MESTLGMKLTDIQADLGDYAGFGRGALFGDPAWTASQQNKLDDATRSGLRRFYYPAPQAGSREGYAWSFLRPTASLALHAGASAAQLPDDFGGLEGAVTLQSTSGILWGPIDSCNEGVVDAKFTVMPTTTGRPQMVAVRWHRETTQVSSQRAELYVWPLADALYTLRFQYTFLPDMLSGNYPYALGGMAHAEAVLESCLAVLEERLDDIPAGSGPHGVAFAARLLASISVDRRSKASNLGYNADRSDETGRRRDYAHAQNPITYNGAAL